MDRRDFLKAALTASFLNSVPLNGWTAETTAAAANKKLVIVFLRGAVDGLNVVIPAGDPRYYEMRPNIAVAKPREANGALDLDGYFALHPSLEPLLNLWSKKKLAFIHSCGSPDPTRSHFDAQDYMESGNPGIKSGTTGWLNRLLTVLPDNRSPVRALNIGPTIPRILAGPQSVANVELNKNRALPIDRPEIAELFWRLYDDDPMLRTAFYEGISARGTINRSMRATDEAESKEMLAANRGALPPQSAFGRQLANLILKEPKTQIVFLAFGGWDTHVNQGAGQGQLANKLSNLALGLADFYQSTSAIENNVTTIVMSEFGRTAHENGNRGTDHGHGNVMWVMGGNVAGGKVHGRWNGLANSALYEDRDLPVTSDFRSVISAVLQGHLKVNDGMLKNVFPNFAADRQLENLLKA